MGHLTIRKRGVIRMSMVRLLGQVEAGVASKGSRVDFYQRGAGRPA